MARNLLDGGLVTPVAKPAPVRVVATAPPRAPAAVYTPPRAPAKVAQPRMPATPAKAPVRMPATPVRKTTSAPARTTGGGGSSGGGGGGGGGFDSGGGGGGFGGESFAAAPMFQDITIPDAMEDTDYKRTIADLARALGDLDAQQGLSRKQYDTGFGEAKRRMGWNETDKKFDRSMPGAYGDAVYTNENDFFGRGLGWSGMFGKASGDINQEFADRGKNLDTARQDNIDTQALARNTYVNTQESTKEAAKQNAISKIMAQFGIGQPDVPVGTGSKVIQRQV